jgi:hypothetical protein
MLTKAKRCAIAYEMCLQNLIISSFACFYLHREMQVIELTHNFVILKYVEHYNKKSI